MTEVVAALSATIIALSASLGIALKRTRNNSSSTPNTLRNDFNAQVLLCNERFITLASDMGSVKSTLTTINERQTRMESKVDELLSKS